MISDDHLRHYIIKDDIILYDILMVTYHTIFNYLQFRPGHLYSIFFSVQNNNEIPRKILQFQYKNWSKRWNAKSIYVPQVSNRASTWPRNDLGMTSNESGPNGLQKTGQLSSKEPVLFSAFRSLAFFIRDPLPQTVKRETWPLEPLGRFNDFRKMSKVWRLLVCRN